jgi:hypothetical protein
MLGRALRLIVYSFVHLGFGAAFLMKTTYVSSGYVALINSPTWIIGRDECDTHFILRRGNCILNLSSCSVALRPLPFFSRLNSSKAARSSLSAGSGIHSTVSHLEILHRRLVFQGVHSLAGPCWLLPLGLDIRVWVLSLGLKNEGICKYDNLYSGMEQRA